MIATLPLAIPAESPAVRASGLAKRFGDTVALSGADLCVPEGSVYVLVGPNGAGKTTILRILLDLVTPDSGSAEVLGLDVKADGPLVRANVGYVPERSDWGYGWMTAKRLLAHHAVYYPSWDREYANRLIREFGIRLDARFGKLSKGEARRIQLVMALAHRPALLLLDEPTDGLDPVVRDETIALLAAHIAETPTSVLISTHLVYEMEGLADHLGVLRNGKLQAQMSIDEMNRSLRRYRAEVPEAWEGVKGLNGSVLRRQNTSREIQWTVWGDEAEVVQHLTGAGARLREVSPISLNDAALALLASKEL